MHVSGYVQSMKPFIKSKRRGMISLTSLCRSEGRNEDRRVFSGPVPTVPDEQPCFSTVSTSLNIVF